MEIKTNSAAEFFLAIITVKEYILNKRSESGGDSA